MRDRPRPKTNVLRILEARGVAYETREYEVDESDLGATHAAKAVGIPVERVFKTLVLRGDKTGVFLCCIPGAEELDLKATAKATGNKSCDLVPMKDIQPLTGYIRGGCSPIGTKKPYPVYIDESAVLFESLSISAGERGLQVLLAPDDLIATVQAVLAPLTVVP
jgi:Cys-tRNA(Pro)/Cys-tRNA(Cys) deacylase